jgi:hypothetical protein
MHLLENIQLLTAYKSGSVPILFNPAMPHPGWQTLERLQATFSKGDSLPHPTSKSHTPVGRAIHRGLPTDHSRFAAQATCAKKLISSAGSNR